jgi:hypothetical protein
VRADVQEPDLRRERRASGQMIAKPISIKDAERTSGGCAPEAVVPTSGDLRWVLESGLSRSRGWPKATAEVSRGQSRSENEPGEDPDGLS